MEHLTPPAPLSQKERGETINVTATVSPSPSPFRGVRERGPGGEVLFFLVALALLALSASMARAQGIAYCNVTKIETKRLVNAVQVTIQADGLMQIRAREDDFFNLESISTGDFSKITKPISILPFRIVNARSQVGSFADVGIYPVSHVEISIPPDAPEGVGLDVRVVLFRTGTTWSLRTGNNWWNLEGLPFDGPGISIQTTPDQRSLIILVASDRRTLPPVEHRKPPADARQELTVRAEKDRVSLYALNTDLRELIREVALQTGRPIQAEAALDRIVSLSLPEVTVEEALQALATTYGLSLERAGPVIRLSEGGVSSLPTYGESALENIPLKYLSAVSARDSLPEFLLRYLHVNPEENALTVFGPRLLVEKVRADVEKIDRPVPQIEIEAMAVEFHTTEDLESFLNQTWRNQPNTYGIQGETGDITYRSLGTLPKAFEANLHALDTRGRAHIRARPRATALNSQTARLFVGQQKYIKVNYYDFWYDTYMSRILAVDVGAKLEITPWTGGSGVIMAVVVPEVSNIVELERGTGLPVVSTRNARTTVRVKDGETLMIGGLSLNQEEPRRRKIPILGDLPLIGWLFRSPKRTRTRTDLALFITARIVTGKSVPGPEEPASSNRKALPLSAWSDLMRPPLPPLKTPSVPISKGSE